jgi:hypothetical protein
MIDLLTKPTQCICRTLAEEDAAGVNTSSGSGNTKAGTVSPPTRPSYRLTLQLAGKMMKFTRDPAADGEQRDHTLSYLRCWDGKFQASCPGRMAGQPWFGHTRGHVDRVVCRPCNLLPPNGSLAYSTRIPCALSDGTARARGCTLSLHVHGSRALCDPLRHEAYRRCSAWWSVLSRRCVTCAVEEGVARQVKKRLFSGESDPSGPEFRGRAQVPAVLHGSGTFP